MEIEKTKEIGFCFGVKRAIDILEGVARERGGVETLGAVVHNQQVLDEMAKAGVRVARNIDDIKGDTVAISSHGVSTEVEKKLKEKHINVINTTCPFVHRVQIAARRLADAGFFAVVYGDAGHTEVKGVLGWAGGKGVATLDDDFISGLDSIPSRLGVLSQTTQIPAHFTAFIKKLIDAAFTKDSKLRIIDTICHDTRRRQQAASELAGRVDLMLVIGGHSSSNTSRLYELCSKLTETHHVETADEIDPAWFSGKKRVGVTSGASTADHTINEVLARLKALA